MEVLARFLAALDDAGMDGAYWAAGEWWGDYALSVQPRDNFTVDRPQLATLLAHSGTRFLTAVSAATGEVRTLAPDSLASAYGVFAPLDRVQIRDSAGAILEGALLYSSGLQVNFVVPAVTAPGRAAVLLRSGDGLIAAGDVRIDSVAPALFSAAQVVRVAADGVQAIEPVTLPTAIERRGASERLFLVLYGSGFRNGPDTSVRIGGRVVPVGYAGPQPQYAGLDQANVELPGDLAGDLALVLSAGGRNSNALKLVLR
jgi:uncharacterized protein (TIGR03437 family)